MKEKRKLAGIFSLYLFSIGYLIYLGFSKTMLSHSIFKKIFGIAWICAIGILFICQRTLFLIFLFLYLLAVFFYSIIIYNTAQKYQNKKSVVQAKEQENGFFDKMNKEEAKKEYRRLMKQYHPDNPKGDPELSKQISEAYRKYCERLK